MNCYADVNQFKEYFGITTPENDAKFVSLFDVASRLIDKKMERVFYLFEGTRYYDGGGVRVTLDDDVYSFTSLDVDTDGDGVYESNYTLDISGTSQPDAFTYERPRVASWPKVRLEANPWGRYGHFGSGIRAAIKIVGVFGFGNDYPAPAYSDSGETITGNMTASDLTLTSTGDSILSAGQTIKIDSEQIFISAYDPAQKKATIQRGVNGTTAATHSSLAAITLYCYPPAITQACMIHSMRQWKRRESAFQNVVGDANTGITTVYKGLDPDVLEIIKDYKRNRIMRYVG
jgi:hypothetical protein